MDKKSLSMAQLTARIVRALVSLQKTFRLWETNPADQDTGTLVFGPELGLAFNNWSSDSKLPLTVAVWCFFLFTCLMYSNRYALVEGSSDLVLTAKYKSADEIMILNWDLLSMSGTKKLENWAKSIQ